MIRFPAAIKRTPIKIGNAIFPEYFRDEIRLKTIVSHNNTSEYTNELKNNYDVRSMFDEHTENRNAIFRSLLWFVSTNSRISLTMYFHQLYFECKLSKMDGLVKYSTLQFLNSIPVQLNNTHFDLNSMKSCLRNNSRTFIFLPFLIGIHSFVAVFCLFL